MERLTGTIEKHRVGAPMPSTNLVERRRSGRGRMYDQSGGGYDREKISPPSNLRRRHGLTSILVLGFSPNISGEYIASTRVGGSPNVPALLNRTVYSMVNDPFGTYS